MNANEERQKLGLDANAFAIYVELRYDVPTVTPEQVQEIDELFKRFPDYKWNQQQNSQLRSQLYKPLILLCGMVKFPEVATKLLNLERI